MSDFIVRIDNTKLTAAQAARVAAAIQSTVLSELGHLDLAPGVADAKSPSGALILDPRWRGIWIRNLKDLQNPQQPALQVAEH